VSIKSVSFKLPFFGGEGELHPPSPRCTLRRKIFWRSRLQDIENRYKPLDWSAPLSVPGVLVRFVLSVCQNYKTSRYGRQTLQAFPYDSACRAIKSGVSVANYFPRACSWRFSASEWRTQVSSVTSRFERSL